VPCYFLSKVGTNYALCFVVDSSLRFPQDNILSKGCTAFAACATGDFIPASNK
jgi:hypothetical protein